MTKGEKIALAVGAVVIAGGAGWLIYEKTKKPAAVAPAGPLPPPPPPKLPPKEPPSVPVGVLAQQAAEQAQAEAAAQYIAATAEELAQFPGGIAYTPGVEEGPLGTPPEWEIPMPTDIEFPELPGAYFDEGIGLY